MPIPMNVFYDAGSEHNVAAADVPGAGAAGGPLLRQPPRVHRRPHRQPGTMQFIRHFRDKYRDKFWDYFSAKGPFKNDVRREGEGGGCPNSDAVREVA